MLNTIGKGGQSKIVAYQNKYACKIMRRSHEAYKELAITERLQHIPGVVKILDVREDEQNVYMIMDKYKVVTHIPDLVSYTKSVLLTLNAIHEMNIIHNDIKQQNIMIDEYKQYKIIDFGCSIYSDQPVPPMTVTTPSFCSAEGLLSKNCKKSDMWAIGVLVYKELTKKYPFNGSDYHEIFREILNKPLDFDKISMPEARDFVQKLLERDVEKRMNAYEALSHPWLTLGSFQDD